MGAAIFVAPDYVLSAHDEEIVLTAPGKVEPARAGRGEIVDVAQMHPANRIGRHGALVLVRCRRRRATGCPFFAPVEEEDLGVIDDTRRFTGYPRVVVLVHVRVVLDVTTHRAIEIPEPVRAEAMAARPPERLVALRGKCVARTQDFRRSTHVEREVFTTLHYGGRLDEEQRVMVLRGSRAQKRAHPQETVADTETEPVHVKRLCLLCVGNKVHDVG